MFKIKFAGDQPGHQAAADRVRGAEEQRPARGRLALLRQAHLLGELRPAVRADVGAGSALLP